MRRRARYAAGAAVAASVASGAAASVALAAIATTHSRLCRPGGGVRPDHPTPTGRPPVPGAAKTIEIQCGHDAMVIAPDRLADLLDADSA